MSNTQSSEASSAERPRRHSVSHQPRLRFCVNLALCEAMKILPLPHDTGATDTEIKIGQTNPFSGPASAYATIGKTQAAYLKMIND
jgi:ABC-type branched-subunit amino acid transport system substrate-binding protein